MKVSKKHTANIFNQLCQPTNISFICIFHIFHLYNFNCFPYKNAVQSLQKIVSSAGFTFGRPSDTLPKSHKSTLRRNLKVMTSCVCLAQPAKIQNGAGQQPTNDITSLKVVQPTMPKSPNQR